MLTINHLICRFPEHHRDCKWIPITVISKTTSKEYIRYHYNKSYFKLIDILEKDTEKTGMAYQILYNDNEKETVVITIKRGHDGIMFKEVKEDLLKLHNELLKLSMYKV